MRRTTFAGTMLLALAASVGVASAASDWLLRVALPRGATHRFALHHSQSMNFEMGDSPQAIDNRSRFEFKQTVTGVGKDGSLVLDTSYERMRSEMSVGTMKVEFDSASSTPSEHPLAKMQRALTGKHFTVTLSDLGEVTSVGGLDALFDALSEQFASDPTLRGALDAARQGFGEESMKSMMQQATLPYPEGRVKLGDTWQRRQSLPNPTLGELRIVSDYRVKGTGTVNDRECLEIGLASTMEFGDSDKMFGQLTRLLGADVDAEVSNARGHGSIWVDLASGLVARSDVTQEVDLVLTVHLPPEDDAAGETVNMTGKIVEAFGIDSLD